MDGVGVKAGVVGKAEAAGEKAGAAAEMAGEEAQAAAKGAGLEMSDSRHPSSH